MTKHQLIFAILYQTPAIAAGLAIKALIPSPPLRAIFVLPGTIIHELLHLIVGFIFNAKPLYFSIWPRQDGPNKWTLGAVGFENIRWYNGAPVGLAPLIAPIIAILFAPTASNWKPDILDIQYWFISTPMLTMCMPSRTDLKISLASAIPLFICGAIIYRLS